MINEFSSRKYDASLYNEFYYNNGPENPISYDDYSKCKGIVTDLAGMIHKVVDPRLEVGRNVCIGMGSIPTKYYHLDVACAYNHMGNAMQELGWESYGFDISDYAIKMAQELYPNLLSWQGSAFLASNYNLRDDQNNGKYDLITANCFFEHAPTSLIGNILAIMQRKSKWGFFILECKTSPFEDVNHVYNEDPTHLHCNDKAWWVAKLSEYGELDWDGMFEFAKLADAYDPELSWAKNSFLIRFS